MPSLAAAVRAVALHRAQQRASQATAQKGLVRGGPLLPRSMIGRPVQNREWSTEQAVDRYFKLSGLVYRSAVSLATAMGSVRWQVEVKTRDRWELAEDHELQALLNRPHKFYNRQAWNEALVLYLALSGNSLNQKTLASGKLAPGAKFPRILEMVPLIPDGIEPVRDDKEWVSSYKYNGQPKKEWQPEEMLHIMLPDPSNQFWGMSPFFAIRRIIQTDLAAIDWNRFAMENRAVSSGVFALAQALTTTQYEEAKDQVWEQHQGPRNAWEPWVLGGDAKWLQTDRSPVEMDFNETRMRIREDVLSSGGIPPVVAGYFENATLANADVSRSIFWEDTVIPVYVERANGGINSGVVPHFGDPSRLRVTYDISGVPALREDLVKKATTLSVFVRAGVPYNDALRELELDLPEIPGLGDVPFGLEVGRPGVGAPAGEGGEGGEPQPDAPATATPAVGTGQEVEVSQSAVLNGAQITAATAIVTAVAAGDIPRDAGVGQLVVLFNLTTEQAEQIMGSAGTGVATTPNVNPAASTPEPSPAAALADQPPEPPPAKRRHIRGRKVDVRTSVFATTVADAEAPAIRRAFLAEIAKLRNGAKLEELVELIRAGDAGAAIAKLGGGQLTGRLYESVGQGIETTARRGANLAADQLARDLGQHLSLDSGALKRWLQPYLTERTAQLTATTEAAARDLFFDLAAGKLGDDPEAVAKLLRETWGLHKQQAAGVRSVYSSLLASGKSPADAFEAVSKLAKVRLGERGTVMAEHESLVAANRGNGLAWEQAVADGAASQVFATWYTEDDGDVDDECVSLEGQEIEVSAGERFRGESGGAYREPPEPHPRCRCGLLYLAIN